jgi:hypothetical protein
MSRVARIVRIHDGVIVESHANGTAPGEAAA